MGMGMGQQIDHHRWQVPAVGRHLHQEAEANAAAQKLAQHRPRQARQRGQFTDDRRARTSESQRGGHAVKQRMAGLGLRRAAASGAIVRAVAHLAQYQCGDQRQQPPALVRPRAWADVRSGTLLPDNEISRLAKTCPCECCANRC